MSYFYGHCKECGAEIDSDDENYEHCLHHDDEIQKPLTVGDAAHYLLDNYAGGNPSIGDVDRLKERLETILHEEFNVSASAME